jgi:hypothetical protein
VSHKANPSFWLRIIGISLILGIAIAEIGIRLAVATLTVSAQEASPIALAHYQRSSYATPLFLSSIPQVFPHGGPNPDDEWALGDLSLPGFTVRDNERLTTDQPLHYTRNVWLYGSSSIWGIFADDAHTIPSYLQREFNKRGLPWRVRNMSQPGIEIGMERYWLTQSAIRPGDLIIFIDGRLDLSLAITRTERRWKASNPLCITSQHIPLMLLNMWCLAEAMRHSPEEFAEHGKAREFSAYWQTLETCRAYALAHGAAFIHFMQPSEEQSPDYVELARGDSILHICPECWFDPLHYDDQGNAEIASQIADYLMF